ncbi:MAG: HK97 family phage prohead protease [Nitrospiria bacterium]
MDELNSRVFAKAEGDFEFSFCIEKAEIPADDDDGYSIVGIASTSNIDHDNERMAEPALVRMAQIINEKSVPLRVEHQKNDNAIIGKINQAWLDERKNLWIKADLDKSHPAAIMLHNALKSGSKLGLSVGGRVKRATRELAEGAGKMIKTFYDVILDEVSVTPRPSNYDAWLVQKHYIGEAEDTQPFYNTRLHDAFLFENPKFDYLLAIEKSIPTQAWKKVEPETKNIEMDIKINKGLPASMEYVDKKFDELASLIKSSFVKMSEDSMSTGTEKEAVTEAPATDQNDPSEVKTEPKVGKDAKDTANGTEGGDREATAGTTGTTEATDQNDPAEVKTEPVATKSGKKALNDLSVKMRKTSSETKVEEKAASSSETKVEEKAASSTKFEEKAASSETEPEEKAVSSDSSETEKADDEERETEDSSSTVKASDYELPELKRAAKHAPSLDIFTAYLADSIEKIESKISKSGKRIPGLRQLIVDTIREDEVIQKSIFSMMRQPGAKRSVSFGIPYVMFKDGSLPLRLVSDSAELKKSVDPKAKFGDVYKKFLSSAQDKNNLR